MAQISELARDACIELFAAYGVDVELAGPPAREPDPRWGASRIGFTGDAARGELVLVASPEILERSSPIPSPGRDWVGELANQLLGRLKRRLRHYGLEISLETPTALRGPPSSEGVWLDGPHGAVRVWIDAQIEVDLANPSGADPRALTEGECLLF